MRWIFILLVFSVFSCHRIEIEYYSVQESQSVLDALASVDAQGRRKDVLLARPSLEQFQERFISSKLDMVFILDTYETRKPVYSKEFLKYDFLNFFYNYDWRLAWTDMSVNVQALQGETEKDQKSNKSKCGFTTKLLMATSGIFFNSSSVAQNGLEGLFDCISNIDLKSNQKQKTSYANGSFLPFESDEKIYYLDKINPHSSVFLYHSLLLPNPTDKAYQAPILKENKSYPLLSMIFSLSKNFYTKSSYRFFREDSLIVFVLFSLTDSKISISPEALQKSLHSTFGSHDRFKLILVTTTDEAHAFCPFKHVMRNSTPKKLIKLVKNMNQPVLDICSDNLGEEIFKEASKGLSSQKIL